MTWSIGNRASHSQLRLMCLHDKVLQFQYDWVVAIWLTRILWPQKNFSQHRGCLYESILYYLLDIHIAMQLLLFRHSFTFYLYLLLISLLEGLCPFPLSLCPPTPLLSSLLVHLFPSHCTILSPLESSILHNFFVFLIQTSPF